MEEDDSQDELVNSTQSHGKRKRAALWAISDESDEVEERSEEEDSESSEGEEDDHPDGEEDGGDDDDDEEEEEEEEGEEDDSDEEDGEELEEDSQAQDRAAGGTSVDLARLSSDDEVDKCPICLNSFSSQPVATPESCEHYFCLDCILEWAKNANSCPVDRIVFSRIYLRKCYGGKVQKMITVEKPLKEAQQEQVDLDLDQTSCEVCGGSDREDRLLLCDGCDAGYHMECLTPPLDAVPVEEWFCPECEANNRHSRGSVESLSETDSSSASARPTTSRSRSSLATVAAGPTRAIARTQHSERVRASVNRHRITQARTAQLAPRFLMQSTWLDETINAVVAGLNTAVYIRDLTPRATTSRRRRTVRRKKGPSKNTSAAKGAKKGKAGTGVKRRKRRVRRTKSRRKMVVKKKATSRSRIAKSIGIGKPKNGSSLPTVYRPSEHTLGNMRTDIGAASLSVYGDPFDLDPFIDGEEVEEQRSQVTSLLEAKRRGISHSALRSHQPVARPIAAGMSRRGLGVPQPQSVVEAAPVPDLLGSILSGQSMLLMDSSAVVINRDGSLKAAKPERLPLVKTGTSRESSSRETSSTQVNSGMSPKLRASSSSSQSSPGPRPFSPFSPSHSQANHSLPASHSHLPPLGHPRLQPTDPNRPGTGHRGSGGAGAAHGPTRGTTASKMAPAKPMWVDVSVLPRIPKIKREGGSVTNDGTHRDRSSSSNSSRSSSRESSSAVVASADGHSNGMPGTGIHSLAGDKGRQQSVDQTQGRPEGQTQRQRPERADHSSAFSNSFSSSCSPASQPHVSSSTLSSAVSFRINSSGNSWRTRRLSSTSPAVSSGGTQEDHDTEDEEAKRRRQHRDKQMLLASHTQVKKEQKDSDIYDPFNPTLSDSNSSDSEVEDKDQHRASPHSLCSAKAETEEREITENEPEQVDVQEKASQWDRGFGDGIRIKKEPESSDSDGEKQELMSFTPIKEEPGLSVVKVEPQTSHTTVKEEPGLAESKEDEGCSYSPIDPSTSRTIESTKPLHYSSASLETKEEFGQNVVTPSSISSVHSVKPSTSSSSSGKKNQKEEVKLQPRHSPGRSKSGSPSPAKGTSHSQKTAKGGGSHKGHRSRSSSSDAGPRREKRHESSQGGRRPRGDESKERHSRRSRSRERKKPRRARSTSDSSQSDSSDRSRRKRRRQRSQSRSRSRRRSRERNNGRGSDRDGGWASKDKRHGRSRSKSRSRSRSRERRKDHSRSKPSSSSFRDGDKSRSQDRKRPRSRSCSKERRKEESSSKSVKKTSGSFGLAVKEPKETKGKKKGKDHPLNKDTRERTSVSEIKKEEKTSEKAVFEVKKESKEHAVDSQVLATKLDKESQTFREVKTEKLPVVDMFEDSAFVHPIKKEESETEIEIPPSSVVESIHEERDVKKQEMAPVKSEAEDLLPLTPSETVRIKSEPGSPELPCHLSPDALPSEMATTPPPSSTVSVGSDASGTSQPPPASSPPSECPDSALSIATVKQEVEPLSDSDSDFNVDMMLDNLDPVKSEKAVGTETPVVKQEVVVTDEAKNEREPPTAPTVLKCKTLVKRVTWNIQEPEGPQPEKSPSKLALYKQKLKQEGARRPASSAQTPSQDIHGAAHLSISSKRSSVPARSAGSPSHSELLTPDRSSSSGPQEAAEDEESDESRKDKYLKKLHMQERAIEEVKLAIKPFYQKRDITKDEYKEILRKAVQKVCHSKSGEINPVKVANLVKAYVDRYKHMRKHKKGEDAESLQNEASKEPESP